MIEIVLQPRAITDLAEIEEFSFHRFGAAVAAEYMAKLERAFDRLAKYPESGPTYPDIRPPVRFTRSGRHYIFYDYDGASVSVVRILHHARVPEDLL